MSCGQLWHIPCCPGQPWQLPVGSAVESMAQVLFALGHTHHQQHKRKVNVAHMRVTFPDTALPSRAGQHLLFIRAHTSPVPVCRQPQEQEKEQQIRKIWEEERSLVRVCPGTVRGAEKHFLLSGRRTSSLRVRGILHGQALAGWQEGFRGVR